MVKVRKGVILAAGWGTRLLPATKAVPKEMLPLVDRPIVQYALEEALASGLEQIILVTAQGKEAIENHFDRSPELERLLEARGDLEALAEIRRISRLADLVYIRQKEQKGIGHAVLTARGAIGEEPFALFFPDDVFDAHVPITRQLRDAYQPAIGGGGSVIAVEAVAREDISKYGVVEARPMGDGLYQVLGLVEKPEPDEAPSNLGIVGRYILTPGIFAALEKTQPGKGGEIQITDALQILLEKEPLYAYQFQGTRYDTGHLLGLLEASVAMALKRPDLGPSLRRFLIRLWRTEADKD